MRDSLHLRSKFIAVAMISVSIVIAVLMTILNASSFIRLARQADQMLQVLASNQGSFPAPIEKPSRNEPPMSPEAPFETRFFSVTFKDDSTVSADTAFITAVNQQKALDFALKVKEEGKERGFIDNYRFLDSGGDPNQLSEALSWYELFFANSSFKNKFGSSLRDMFLRQQDLVSNEHAYAVLMQKKKLNSLECDLLCIRNIQAIPAVLEAHLPALGIPQCYLVTPQ
ncbi:MAG: hypothetical protein WCR70_07150, partial [Sphaerochaetaceae bacterium]